MEEAQEKDMDSDASFKSGKILTITGGQYNVCSQNQMINLLVSSNRYGYIFYATETDGLALIPSSHIDQQSHYLSKSSEDDDDDDINETTDKTSIIYRSYIPGQSPNKTSSIPYWLALNADETILALVLRQLDAHAWLIILYDVVKLIQMPDSTPLCPPIRLSSDMIGQTIQNFAWNPTIATRFVYLDGLGSISSVEIDLNSKQTKVLGKSEANDDYSSICWSPKGKQLVVVKYDGALELYEPNMTLKKSYASATNDPSFPPCISVLWISTHQFLLGFSENSPDENATDGPFFQIMVTYDKDQTPKTQIYPDLFFDAFEASSDINPQYFYVRVNESKIIISGLSKSLKINVLGPDELRQDSLDIWTFADQFRATVKGSANASNKRPILTGMALGLNSTLSISEGNTKLPPCPVLLLSNSEGVLQVYYYIHKNLPSICRTPEVIKQIQAPSLTSTILGTPLSSASVSQVSPLTSFQSVLSSVPPSNGFSLTNFGSTPTTTANQSKGTTNTANFSFNSQPPQTTVRPVHDDISKSIGATGFNISTPVQQPPVKTVTNNGPPSSNNKKLLQTVDEFQSKLKSVQKPIFKPAEPPVNLDQSLANLTATLNNMTTTLQTSTESIKTMTSEHIESMTDIENALHQIKLSQKENLYHLLKDRELDPWTQSRLDSIKTKYDRLKHHLNVLLQLTHTTIHDRSLSTNDVDDDDTENEDFLPDLEISLNKNETMKQRIQNRIKELSHKVAEVEKDLESICGKLKGDLLSSSTSTKTTLSSSSRSFHALDAQILSYLQATHPIVLQIRVPPPAVINLSSSTNEQQKKQSTIEVVKSIPPSIQPSTPKQPNSPTVETESFKNMLRIVRTSIDLFSGVTSPEQLQELSNTIATSPLSSSQRSHVTSMNKTPTTPKTTSLSKTTTTITKSLQTTMTPTSILQTPARSVASPVPTIAITPATPAAQTISTDTSLKLQQNRPIVQTATDLTKTQSSSGDNAIRSLLNNALTPSTTITSISNQPFVNTAPIQVVKPTLFGNPPSTSTAPVITTTTSVVSPVVSTPASVQSVLGVPSSPVSTIVTSVQSTSPTTRPIVPTGFGARPLFGGTAFNSPPTTSANTPFGSAATSMAPASTPFGGFGVAPGATVTTTVATSTPSTGPFGTSTSSIPSPFGSGFGASPATTTTAPATGIFGGGSSAPATSAPNTGIFGGGSSAPATSAPTTSTFGGFGSTPATATTSASSTGSFGSGFGGGSTTTTSPFGASFNTTTTTSGANPFGAPPSISSGSTFSGFGAPAAIAPTSTTNTSIFGGGGGGGSSVFGFNTASPATSTATSTAGTSPFGSNFSSFTTQSNLSGQSTGFSFGGFGSQPANTTPTQTGFSSFGSPSGATQPPSPFGAPTFGGASGQSPSFSAPSSSFGASSAPSASSPSFTTYRK